MKSHSTLSFIVAVILYSLLLAVGYWLWTSYSPKENIVHKVNQVPVTLAMFSEPTVVKETPIETPESVSKEVVEKAKPRPKTKPKIEPKPKPIPKIKPKPKTNPKPVKKPPKQLKKVIEKKPKKAQPTKLPKKTNTIKVTKTKPVEAIKTTKPTKSTKPVVNASKTKPVVKAKPAYSSQQVANAEQNYLNNLRKVIMEYAQDSYPRRAKRRHWQGDVIIKFNLLPNGTITAVTIIESSGKSILDQAALEIFQVKMANYFKPFPKEINRKNWSIKVPVGYHLK